MSKEIQKIPPGQYSTIMPESIENLSKKVYDGREKEARMDYRNGKRYLTMSQYCEGRYGGRIVKIPLSSGCSCPNRDKTRGTGGCAFCWMPPQESIGSLSEQYQIGCGRLLPKWPNARPVGYFQDYSNTHLPVRRLAALLWEAASLPGIAGLRLATRADCVDREKAALLFEVQQKTGLPVEIELGLQTVHDKTAEQLNRCHSFCEFVAGYSLLQDAGLYLCVHLINGLPGETPEMMVESARTLAALRPGGVKLHMLHLLRDTALARRYRETPFPLLSREEYVGIVCRQLEELPPETVIERLTGDGAADALLEPEWTRGKRAVLNLIDQQLARRNTRQGARVAVF